MDRWSRGCEIKLWITQTAICSTVNVVDTTALFLVPISDGRTWHPKDSGIYYLTLILQMMLALAQTVTRTINVVDSTAPVITLNGESNITHEAGTAYLDANATWADVVDGQGLVYGVGDVNVSKPGIYYLTFDYKTMRAM